MLSLCFASNRADLYSAPFCPEKGRIAVEYLIFLPLLFAAGYWLGKWQNRHYRRDRLLAGQRLLQLRTLSLGNR